MSDKRQCFIRRACCEGAEFGEVLCVRSINPLERGLPIATDAGVMEIQ